MLSLVYLRETQHQQHWADTTALVTHNKQDRYRGYWGTGVLGYMTGTGVLEYRGTCRTVTLGS